MEFAVENNGSLEAVAKCIIEKSLTCPIILFTGELGAGKTTLIKAIGESLGFLDQMNSPSFGIINAYDTTTGETFYHMDLYRLNDASEAWDIGLMEILESGSVCWVEWPEILEKVWQTYDTVSVHMELEKGGLRRIFVT